MSRTVNLWQYLPPFLQDFRELRELFAAEQPEFRTFAEEMDKVLMNYFITSANEDGLIRFEALLNILPSANATTEERRNAVLAKWYDATPFTTRALKNRLAMMQGNDNVSTFLDEADPYRIHIITHCEKAGQVDSVGYIIKTMLPANLTYNSENWILGGFDAGLWYGCGLSATETLLLTNDLNETIVTECPAYVGVGASITGECFLTNDLNETVTNHVMGYTGIGASVTWELTING